MGTDLHVKAQLVRQVRVKMRETYDFEDFSAACLFWADVTVSVFNSYGFDALLQAGTCMWPRLDVDDGVSPTHFSYVFERSDVRGPLPEVRGPLPEMHVWVALPRSDEIVDLTTCFLPRQCRSLLGLGWPGVQPPDYLWCNVDDLPFGVRYEPHLLAIVMSIGFLTEFGSLSYRRSG